MPLRLVMRGDTGFESGSMVQSRPATIIPGRVSGQAPWSCRLPEAAPDASDAKRAEDGGSGRL